jgi:two-component system, chemotaxis family, chemotaxis protein CheY
LIPEKREMPETILAVDDSLDVREMLTLILNGAGYGVLEAVDGEDGLAKAGTGGVDLVLSDQNMPKMDGLTMVRSLRAMPQYKSVPILMLTTEAGAEMKKLGKEAGVTGWLVKPFAPPKLLEAVKKVLGARPVVSA